MARADLEALRDDLLSYGYLTLFEQRAIKYWGEERLSAAVQDFAAITEAEVEAWEPTDEQAAEMRGDERPRGQEDYYDDYPDDDFGVWDYEVTVEYDER